MWGSGFCYLKPSSHLCLSLIFSPNLAPGPCRFSRAVSSPPHCLDLEVLQLLMGSSSFCLKTIQHTEVSKRLIKRWQLYSINFKILCYFLIRPSMLLSRSLYTGCLLCLEYSGCKQTSSSLLHSCICPKVTLSERLFLANVNQVATLDHITYFLYFLFLLKQPSLPGLIGFTLKNVSSI